MKKDMKFISHQIAGTNLAEDIINQTFGPGRYAKTAQRLREYNTPLTDLCYYIQLDDDFIGTIQYWKIHIQQQYSSLLLGPIAILPQYQNQGYGMKLMTYTLNIAKDLKHERVFLVGDYNYYKQLGFEKVSNIFLPGPVDYSRLLCKELTPNALLNVEGMIGF
jgi:predicted N-acetyltransferase YhbS